MGMKDQKPIIFMVLLQVLLAGITLITRATFVNGMSPRVFLVYRETIATLLMAPIALLTRRKSSKCRMGWKNFWLISLLSLTGVTINQNMYFEGLYLASSSIASALGNIMPAITFVMAYIVGLEKIKMRSLRSMAKILGTIICVFGAVSMVMIKGPKLLNSSSSSRINGSFLFSDQNTNYNYWFLGCLLIFGSYFLWSLWLILQVPVSKSYPNHSSLTAWMCCMAAVQSGIVAFFMEPDFEAWKLKSYKDLGSCLISGVGSAATFLIVSWCASRKGPLFPAMFTPLSTVIVTSFSCIFLHEKMYTGRLVGSVAVISGLYAVLWGKQEEEEEEEEGDLIINQIDDHQQKEREEDNYHYYNCKINDLEQPFLVTISSPDSKNIINN